MKIRLKDIIETVKIYRFNARDLKNNPEVLPIEEIYTPIFKENGYEYILNDEDKKYIISKNMTR